MRTLVLFDVDGTLVQGGPAKEAFREALIAVFGTTGPVEGHEFSGKTDPQIARELLRAAGFGDPEIDEGLPRVWERYLEGLEARLPRLPLEVLPGVEALLDALEGRVALGLLTGNIARGAELKLGSVGLAERFPVGGFGSDRESRNDLVPVVLERARREWGSAFDSRAVFVVGDTPRDVACGRVHGLRTVAVATGRFSRADLVEAGADHTLERLEPTREVLEILLETR